MLVNGVDTLPALMAGEKVVSQGSVPKISEIEKLVEKALAETPATGNTEKKTRSDRKREGIPQCTGCGRACYLNESASARQRSLASSSANRISGMMYGSSSSPGACHPFNPIILHVLRFAAHESARPACSHIHRSEVPFRHMHPHCEQGLSAYRQKDM